MKDLREQLIKLAFQHPEIREDLLPVLQVRTAKTPTTHEIGEMASDFVVVTPYVEHVTKNLKNLKNVDAFREAVQGYGDVFSAYVHLTDVVGNMSKAYFAMVSQVERQYPQMVRAQKKLEADRVKVVKALEKGMKEMEKGLKEDPDNRELRNYWHWGNEALSVLRDDVDFK